MRTASGDIEPVTGNTRPSRKLQEWIDARKGQR